MANTVSKTVSDEELNAMIQIESAGKPNARASTSSASGLGQHLNATWLGLVKKYRPEWMKGRDRTAVLNLRFNPSYSIEMLARLAEESRAALGARCTGGDLYLAHFLGVADARDFFRADPNTPSTSLVSEQVVTANRSIFEKNKTAGAIRAWAARKMAQPPSANWVAKFYTGEQPRPAVKPKPELPIDDDVRGRKIEQPLPAEEPEPEVEPADPAPPVTPAPTETQIQPKPREGFFEWVQRKAKTVVGWVSSVVGGGGVLTYFTDWKVMAVVVCGIIVGVTIAYGFWLLAQRKKPKPVDPL